MAKHLSRIIVIDVESTCWERQSTEMSEIIEIGVCTLDVLHGGVRIAAYVDSILINPRFSTVSEFCEKLTGHDQAKLDHHGCSYWQALDKLKPAGNGNIKNCVWASYGDYDRIMFEKMAKLHNTEYPFGSRHINVKTLFAIAYDLSHEIGMDGALKLAGMELLGRHHNGGDDAHNIARLLAHLIKRMRTPTS